MKNFMKILFAPAYLYAKSIPQPPALRHPAQEPIDILLTGLSTTGCCESCGYTYCPSLDICVRPWETYCQELDFPYNALYKGSGIILPLNKKSISINNGEDNLQR